MGQSSVDAVGIAVFVFITLTVTLHLWGHGVTWLIRRSAKNVAIVEAQLIRTASRAIGQRGSQAGQIGQGQDRPPAR